MAGYFIMFGMGPAFLLATAVPFGRRRSRFGGRALCHLGTMVTVIAMSVTAALIAVAFLGEHLVGAPDLARFFAWGNLGSVLYWMLVLLFAAVTGLVVGCAGVVSPESLRRRHWHWRRQQRWRGRAERCTGLAEGCGGGWYEFAGRCLVYGTAAAATLPVLVVYVILASVDAARLAARGGG